MHEKIENEWIERNRYNRGKPIGYRQYKTEFDVEMTIEKVILAIEELMLQRNAEKIAGNDEGIFAKELLEDVWIDKDGCWRYVVSMAYIAASSEIRKKCQAKREQEHHKLIIDNKGRQ